MTTSPRRWPAALARVVLGLLGLAALLGGVPMLLLEVGHLPSSIPSPSRMVDVLTAPDDGTLLLAAFTLAGWVAWLWLVIPILVEAAAVLARRGTPRLPAMGTSQRLAGFLIGTILASGSAAATASAATPAVAASTAADQSTQAAGQDAKKDTQAGPKHRVSGSNPTLWGIAEERLGDGTRYTEILDLNSGLPQSGDLPLGTMLTLPSDATTTPDTADPEPATDDGPAGVNTQMTATTAHIVESGDTLWGISEDQLGDGSRYTELYEANKPELKSPALIYPGQKLTVPPKDEVVDESGPDESGSDDATEDDAPSTEPPPVEEPSLPDGQPEPSETPESAAPSSPSVAPSPSAEQQRSEAAQPAGSAQDDRSGTVVALSAGVGLLAAGLVGSLYVRRVVQQRRRRHGRRIAMPQGPAAHTEEELRATQPPVDPGVLDGMLRHAAAGLADQGGELPQLRAVVLGGEAVELHLAEAMPPVPPFTAAEGDERLWVCPVDAQLMEAEELGGVEQPYPGLVVLGTTADGQLVLVDLEQVGMLQVTGPGRHAVARSLALELAVSQLAGHLKVMLPEVIAPGLGAVSDRVEVWEDTESLLGPLRTHHAAQQSALSALGLTSLRQARLGEAGSGGWTPYVAFDTRDGDALRGMVATEPRTSTAVVLTEAVPGEPGGWVLDTGESHVRLPGTGVECQLNSLGDQEYEEIIGLLAKADAEHDVPAADSEDSTASSLPEPRAEPLSGAVAGAGLFTEFADLELESDSDELALESEGGHERARQLPADDPSEAEDTESVPAPSTGVGLPEIEPAEEEVEPVPAPATGDAAGSVEAADTDEPDAGLEAPVVRVLGTVEIAGTQGERKSERMRAGTELTAWLMFHPGSDRDALEFALWRGQLRRRETATELISRTRAWLGATPDGGYHLPIIAKAAHARYALADTVGCDWHQFQALVERGKKTSGPAGTKALREALELVRGTPFSGVPPHRYVWAEPLVQEIIAAVVDAAEMLSERYLVAGAARDALWAAVKGLSSAPESEQLYRAKFAALAALGDFEGLQRAADELDELNDALGVEAEEATLETLRMLMSRS